MSENKINSITNYIPTIITVSMSLLIASFTYVKTTTRNEEKIYQNVEYINKDISSIRSNIEKLDNKKVDKEVLTIFQNQLNRIEKKLDDFQRDK